MAATVSSTIPIALRPNSLQDRVEEIRTKRTKIVELVLYRIDRSKFNDLLQLYNESDAQFQLLEKEIELLTNGSDNPDIERFNSVYAEAIKKHTDLIEKIYQSNIKQGPSLSSSLVGLQKLMNSFSSIANYLLGDLAYRLLYKEVVGKLKENLSSQDLKRIENARNRINLFIKTAGTTHERVSKCTKEKYEKKGKKFVKINRNRKKFCESILEHNGITLERYKDIVTSLDKYIYDLKQSLTWIILDDLDDKSS